jgi:hypothetical protein
MPGTRSGAATPSLSGWRSALSCILAAASAFLLDEGAATARAARVPREPVQPGQLSCFPTQVAVTRDERRALHARTRRGARAVDAPGHHVASVMVDRNLFFSDVVIESIRRRQAGALSRTRKARRSGNQAADRALPVGVLPGGTANGRRGRHERAMPENIAMPIGSLRRRRVRFQALVQSPLRAGLLRFLCAHPAARSTPDLMQTFGRMRLDIENCLRELVAFGVAARGDERRRRPDLRLRRSQPRRPPATLLDEFLQRRPPVTTRTARRPCSASAR